MSTTRGLGTRFNEMKKSAATLLPERLRKDRRARGAAELSVVVVTGSLVAGVFFGQGLNHTAVNIADGLTWLSDSPSGEVVQVNPATGELQNRQLVAKPGDDLQVSQYDGKMYVTNQTTGRLMSYDVTNLLVSGQRRVSAGGAVNTMSHDGNVFLVDTDLSTISEIDPVTTDAIGTIWVSPSGLADVAMDGAGTVWALEDDGTLHELQWSEDSMEFLEKDKTQIDLSGQGSVLVAHDKGVTVFGPDSGIVQQVGTGDDLRADAPKVAGTLMAPERTPQDIVPVATEDDMVVIVTPDHVQDVDMATYGCAKAGTPEVFHEVVYVPCSGTGSSEQGGRVVKLDTSGNRVGDDITTPGSNDPELVLDDANLIINTPGAPDGVVVHSDGTTSGVVREDPSVPVTTPAAVGTDQPPVDQVLDNVLGGAPTTPPAPHPTHPTSTPTSKGPSDQPTDRPTDRPTHGGDTPSSDPTGSDPSSDPTDCHSVLGCVLNGGGHGGGHPGHQDGGRGDHGGDGGGTSHGGRPHGGDPTPTDTPTTPVHTDPLGAPTNVTAVALPEAQVQITWDDDTNPAPEGFIIRDNHHHEYVRTKNYLRQAIVDVVPGESLSFTVAAILDDQQAESKPTAYVTSTARPDAPTVTGSAVYSPAGYTQKFVATVNWTEAAANGSDVTLYDVTAQIGSGTPQEARTDGDGRTTTFTWTCDMGADPGCRVGGDVSVTVTPVNADGAGQAGATTIVAPPQPDAPLPPEGTVVVDPSQTKKTTADTNGTGSITIKLKAPTSWAKFPGTCAYTTSDDAADAQPVAVACNATSMVVSFSTGPRYVPDSGDVQHTVYLTASNTNGTAHAKSFTYTSHQDTVAPPTDPGPGPVETPPCAGCPYN